ncbi:MAG: ABC transporter permease [Solirubrobacterales bacterium]
MSAGEAGAAEEARPVVAVGEAGAGARYGSRALQVFGMPLILAGVLGVLVLYLNSIQPWGAIEQENLTLNVVRNALEVHLKLTVISTAIVLVIAIPLGILLTREFARTLAAPVLAVANIGQAVPSIGVLSVFAVLFGIGIEGVIFALVLYCVLSVLRNTMVGIEQVDPALLEAGRGMGMSKLQILRRVELPLAVPVMLAGIRTALIINVGTATLAAFTLGAPGDGSNGLGELINSGIRLGRDSVVLTGATLTAVLALTFDWAAGLVERYLRPKGL